MKGLRVGPVLVGLFLPAAVIGPWLGLGDPMAIDLDHQFETPTAAHPLGTADNGVDLLGAMLHGARLAALVALVVVGASVLVGTLAGAWAGLRGGLFDFVLGGVMDLVQSFPGIILNIAILISAGTIAVMTAIAALDFMFQKYQFTKQMRMSKQEVKDEHKQSEGDPQVKARIRALRQQRARERMMAAVPEADVVITNPTHYAVALKYDMEEMPAPKLIAKGIDTLAFRIREVAEEHDIPIVENPPLARALHASVELDEEIPPEHFVAVAEVIGYVMRMKGKTLH